MPTDVTRLALEAVEDYLRGEVRKCFAESRDPYGVPWKPLKSRKGRPLVKTGRMMAGVTATITGNGLELADTVPYAAFHNEGTRTVPRRAFFAMSPEWVRGVEEVIAGVMDRELAKG